MKNKNHMTTGKIRLEDPELKRNPFSVPEGYFSTVEDAVRARTDRPVPKADSLLLRLKPALMLGITFGIIAGLGYIVSDITDRMTDRAYEENAFVSLMEDGYLRSQFVYSYYEQANIGQQELLDRIFNNNVQMDDEMRTYMKNTLTEEDIFRLLNIEE